MSPGFVVIDTETSGLFDFSKPADADGQPRLAHLAMITLDAELNEIAAADYFVKPDGWVMGDEAQRVNGLTMEFLAEKGLPISEVLAIYIEAIDKGFVVVTFNAQFDTKVMRGELRRAGIDDRFERTPNICVMRALTDVCCIPKANGRGFKFPKLSQAMAHFGIEQRGAHSADGDARAALELFRKLRELAKCPEPAVHFAKDPLAAG
jgi:DNA polymerase III subunit epsilon